MILYIYLFLFIMTEVSSLNMNSFSSNIGNIGTNLNSLNKEPIKPCTHNWYVIGKIKEFPIDNPVKINIKDTPITVWRDKNNNFAGIHDVCPHRGASLACGRIDKLTNTVVCPYHTFKYNKKGRLVQIPGQESIRQGTSFSLKTDVPYYKLANYKDWVYLYNKPLYEIPPLYSPTSADIWHEREAYNPKFKYVLLEKEFNIDARTVTENSLDILHISEVHTFGNKKRPLPLSVKTENIAEGHVKVTYDYETSKDALAYSIFGEDKLIIENEYVLPHYTVARVMFGPYTNTIVTSALPISNNKTKLFVKFYRDNWVYNFAPFDFIFDKLSEYLMETTLNEDKAVIDNIYPEYKDGNFITKYDDLVKKYREDYDKFVYKYEL